MQTIAAVPFRLAPRLALRPQRQRPAARPCLGRGDDQQFQSAVANQDLAAKGPVMGRHAFTVGAERDGIGALPGSTTSQGLQVVRVGRGRWRRPRRVSGFRNWRTLAPSRAIPRPRPGRRCYRAAARDGEQWQRRRQCHPPARRMKHHCGPAVLLLRGVNKNSSAA